MRNRTAVLLLLFLLVAALGVLELVKLQKEMPSNPPSVSISEEKKIPEAEKNEEKEEKKKEVKKEVKKVTKKRIVKRDVEGWLPYLTIGRNPYAPYQTPEKDRKILTKKGYTKEEITEYLELREKGEGVYMAFFKGEKFLWVVFGNARVVEKLRAVWKVPQPGTLYQLKSGRNIVVLDECENLAEVSPRPVEQKEEVILPPVVEVPSVEAPPVAKEEKPQPSVVEAPPVEPTPVPEALEEKEEEAPCWLDPKLVAGYETEPSHNGGDDLRVVFASSALYCMWRAEDNKGDHGLGTALQASLWKGDVNREDGHFKGYLLVGGPAYQKILDEGKNYEIRLLGGVLDEKFKQDGFRSHRRFGVVGIGLVYNDYERWLRGYRWRPKYQLWTTLLTPFTSSLKHSFNGEPITETDPPGLDLYMDVGGRLYLYDNDLLIPYVQGGFFAEIPGVRSLALRVGFSDPNFIFGFGIGPDINLITGGHVLGLGFWFDIFHLVRTSRDGYLTGQLVDVTEAVGGGSDVVVSNGIIMIRVAEDSASVSSGGQQPNGVSDNVVGSPSLDGSPTE